MEECGSAAALLASNEPHMRRGALIGGDTMSMQKTASSGNWLAASDALAAQWQDLMILVARVLFGWIFVMSGWGKLMNIAGFVATMPRRGLPDFLGYVAPFVEFGGGALLLLGFATRYVSVVMLVFIIIATFSSHRYWEAEPAQLANQSTHFWKNVSMMGAAFLLFVTGAGRYAADTLFARKP